MKNFDQIMKEKLESMEMGNGEQAWAEMEQKLDLQDATTPTSSGSGMSGLWAGVIAAAIMTSVMVSIPVLSDNEHGADEPASKATVLPASEGDKSAPESEGVIAAQEVHEITLVPVMRNVKTLAAEQQNDYLLEESKGVSDSKLREQTQEQEPSDNLGEMEIGSSLTGMADFEIKAKGIQCPGSSVEFSAIGLGDEYQIAWLFDGILPKEGNEVYHSFREPGLHEVVAIVTQKSTNLSIEHVHSIEIFERPVASINIELIPSETCFNQTVVASAAPSSNAYSWAVGIGREREAEKLEFSAMPGTYIVKAVATNPQGCTQRFEKSVAVSSSFSVWTPNAFSPDGNSVNDRWFPTGLDREGLTFTLEVFRANGALVYSTSELKPWDGSISGTSERPRAGEVFSWRYVAEDACGNTIKDGGALTVMR